MNSRTSPSTSKRTSVGLSPLPSPSSTTSPTQVASTSSPSPLCSSTVNLFRVPHSRMKELVESRLRKVPAAQIPDIVEDASLQAIYEAMWEFKSHEYIENHFIMDRLKARLQSRRIFNQLVCNCHEDSKLLGVIRLVERIYSAKTKAEKEENSKQLKEAIEQFLDEFVHHMEEEEAVFQPLLNENFEPKELIAMNEMVLKQHTLFREKVKSEKSLKAIKRKQSDEVFDEFEFSIEDLRFRKTYCQEVSEFFDANASQSFSSANMSTVALAMSSGVGVNIDDLPDELQLMIFSYLSPRDLLRVGQVEKRWNRLALSPSLWQNVLPTQWARGNWSFAADDPDQIHAVGLSSLHSSTESLSELAAESGEDMRVAREIRVYNGVIDSLLPRVGSGVTNLVLSHSNVLSSHHVRMMLKQCHNVRALDLSYTYVNDKAFQGLFKSGGALRQIEELNFEGCQRVDDCVIELLKRCYFRRKKAFGSKLRKLNLSGCKQITSYGLEMLVVHQTSLEELDLSGCYRLDGESLRLLADECPKLKPHKLAYCNDIEDGPYPLEANGCLNLDCSVRFCCQQLRN